MLRAPCSEKEGVAQLHPLMAYLVWPIKGWAGGRGGGAAAGTHALLAGTPLVSRRPAHLAKMQARWRAMVRLLESLGAPGPLLESLGAPVGPLLESLGAPVGPLLESLGAPVGPLLEGLGAPGPLLESLGAPGPRRQRSRGQTRGGSKGGPPALPAPAGKLWAPLAQRRKGNNRPPHRAHVHVQARGRKHARTYTHTRACICIGTFCNARHMHGRRPH